MFKRILVFASTSGKVLISAATLSFVVAELLWIYLLYLAVDVIGEVAGGETDALGGIIVWGVALLLAKAFFDILADYAKHLAGFNVVETVRLSLIAKLKSLSLGFFANNRLGELSTVIHKDVDNLEHVVGHFLSVMFSDIAVAAIVGIWLFTKSWVMGLCMISFLPFAVLALSIGWRKTSDAQRRTNNDLADMVSMFVECTKGIPLMKAFSDNSTFLKKLDASIEKFGASSKNQSKLGALTSGRFGFLFDLSSTVMLVAGALLLQKGAVDMETFIYFIIFTGSFYRPIAKLEMYFLEYVRVSDSYRRVMSVLETPSVPAPLRPKDAGAFDVAFKGVSFAYPAGAADAPDSGGAVELGGGIDHSGAVKPGGAADHSGAANQASAADPTSDSSFSLRDVNFTVPQGSLCALVGPSGSGKTTVTSLLLRFWEVDKGTISIGGVDIRDMDYDALLENISIVMQNVYLSSDSILDNIRIGRRDATREQVIAAAKKARIHEFILSLPQGYDTTLRESGVNLSGGQKQRLSIARAFLKGAPIVVLDEITSNIDPINEAKIQHAVSELARDRTVLVIAHHLHTIRTADQIVVFDDGRIVERGKHKDLLERDGLYGKLWSSQNRARGWRIA
jgi:ATP-binding cassette subfamily B protein